MNASITDPAHELRPALNLTGAELDEPVLSSELVELPLVGRPVLLMLLAGLDAEPVVKPDVNTGGVWVPLKVGAPIGDGVMVTV